MNWAFAGPVAAAAAADIDCWLLFCVTEHKLVIELACERSRLFSRVVAGGGQGPVRMRSSQNSMTVFLCVTLRTSGPG